MASAAVNEHIIRLDPAEIASYQERQKRGERLADEAERLKRSLRDFIRASWPIVWPNIPFVDGWHIDVICEKLEAVSDGEIRRLQVWVPPGTMKSTTVSILWPAWEWTHHPEMRYITASYAQDLATRFAVKSRDLIRSHWYQSRFPHVELKRDHDLKQSYANTNGGERAATSPGGQGTGIHGDRIVIDDPINALEITSEAALEQVIEWHDGTIATRFTDPKTSAEVIIMQRLHEKDLAGHVLEQEDWTVLCLPETYEPAHPFAYPEDPRTELGELLWPERVGPDEHDARVAKLGPYRAAGQLQQRPAPLEGALLKRADWRYYDRSLSFYRLDGVFDRGQARKLAEVARFSQIVHSWDTSLKDGVKNDYVSGQVWGIAGANRYLLRLFKERRGLNATIVAMDEIGRWAIDLWPHLPQRILVENAANGPDAIAEMRKRLDGVMQINARGSKELRAAAAAPALESNNCYLPGEGKADLSSYTARTPEDVQAFVESCAVFPNGAHDDDVDAWSQMVNWTRSQARGKSGITRAHGRMPRVGQLGA